MKTQTMKLSIGGGLKIWTSAVTLATFLFVQALPASFAQEMVLEPQKLLPEQSAASAPQPEKPQVDQSSLVTLQGAAKPLSIPANQEKKNAQPEVRGLDEYSFNEALDQLQPDIASAVIVKKISAADLRKLLDLKIEVGIAVVHGKIVLFTSGEEDQIRMLPAAKELLEQASVIAHTHPHGAAMPSIEDFMEAGAQTEYVVSDQGIYAYNHDGLIYEKPLSFGYLVGKINAVRKPNVSTKATRDLLNEFIASMDEYNEQPETAVLFRAAIPETTAASNPNFSFLQTGSNFYLKNKVKSQLYFLVTIGTGETIPYFDVNPAGTFAFFNLAGSAHPNGGYAKIFKIATNTFVTVINPANGQVSDRINGVLYPDTPSAFNFVEGFVVFSFHSGGYNPPVGGIILNLNKPQIWITQTSYITVSSPILLTPTKDKLLFGGSSGIGIYNVATGAVNYQASVGTAIRAISADGQFAIAASTENVIYAVSIQNLGQATRSVTVPLPCNIAEYSCWSGRVNYALTSANFSSPTSVGGTLVNGNQITLYVDSQKFQITSLISPTQTLLMSSPTLTLMDIKPLPTNGVTQGSIVFPAVTFIAPAGATATGTIGGDRGHYFSYQTNIPGWAGTGLTYDNFSTPAIETGDINGLAQLTFGIVRGNPTYGFATRVKFEIVDNLDRKAHVYLDGIGDVEKAWAIPTSYFRNAGVDLTKVRVMYFIVEGQNLTGALQINQYSPGSSLPQFSLTPANITILPGDPQKNHVAPAGADSSGAGTPRGMFLNYTTGTPGWAGGGFSYDNFSTPTIETGDISQYQNLSFGLKGDPSQVKFEVLDAFGHKTSIYLHGIRSDVEQVWSISTQTIASYGVDLTKIRWIYFIVEGKNLTGSVEINKVPAIAPSAAAITPLPATPRVVRIAPTGVTANVSTISRGARLDYNTLTPGWAGVGFGFNDPATPATESVNLSSFSNLTFGLKGNPTQVKFELVDASGRKASLVLTGISSTSEQRWSIPTSMFFGNGIDLTHITNINFIVEGQNQSGALEVYRM